MEPRIVDVVFARADLHPWRRAATAWSAAAIVGVAAAAAIRMTQGPGCECGVRMAPRPPPTRLIAIDPPEAPPPEKPLSPPTTAHESPDRTAPPSPRQPPPSFAQAAPILARQESPDAPVDLTGEAFVTGSGPVFSGGLTNSSGTSAAAVTVAPAPKLSTPPPVPTRPRNAVDLSRTVGLPDPSWTCPWPAGAESEALDEQSAFVQVTVRPDGSVERAVVLLDPGLGFGEAARRCAAAARFAPALDSDGRPVRAVSPPIRVRFVR